MPVSVHFLGWGEPVTHGIRRHVLGDDLGGDPDLERDLIVVPTRQAGRRLREAMALFCAHGNAALLSARVVTPSFFLHREQKTPRVATESTVKAVWADVLTSMNPAEYGNLFPGRVAEADFAWAMRTGEMLQDLRKCLAHGGYSICSVVEELGADQEEAERWGDLARLERAYASRLARLRTLDPLDAQIDTADRPERPDRVERIVMAAVPDPSPLAMRALSQLAEQGMAIDVLVHAPPELADRFDAWGRPLPEAWSECPIAVPAPDENLVLAGSPLSQSRAVLQVMAGEAFRFGPADFAVGVPDRNVAPYLASALADVGVAAFDPADVPAREHPVYRLLARFQAVVQERSYPSVARLLRHPDFLEYLAQGRGLPPARLLSQLDRFQNAYLPVGLDDIVRFLDREPPRPAARGPRFELLARAIAALREQVDTFEKSAFEEGVRSFLQTVYDVRTLHLPNPADDAFGKMAGIVDDALCEFREALGAAGGLTNGNALALLLRRLAEQAYHRERTDAMVDLEGWLELAWSDAPCLIVTGMNEGMVPDGRLSDIFLPDSLRTRLGLPDDARRCARDSYLMTAVIESRKAAGRTCFVVGKTSREGDPLKPSRLLFRCRDEELPARARRLFGPVEESRGSHPSTVSFRLDPSLPPDPAADATVSGMSVTSFRDYIACPFRFYLRHVLEMDPLDDEKEEPDALDFGTVVHAALEAMGRDEGMRRCRDGARLSAFLVERVGRAVRARFGAKPPLPVLYMQGAAEQRLAWAARRQVELVEEGWDIVETERRYEMTVAGMQVRGTIDRVDRHGASGRVRVIDYKTSDTEVAPQKAHLARVTDMTPDFAVFDSGGRAAGWIDLQLPLYVLLLQSAGHDVDRTTPAYFNLPKAVAGTGLYEWEDFGSAHLDGARACAEAVVRRVSSRVFWPPAEKVRYDDFERLFTRGVRASVLPPPARDAGGSET